MKKPRIAPHPLLCPRPIGRRFALLAVLWMTSCGGARTSFSATNGMGHRATKVSSVALNYTAITDRLVRPEPSLPAIGPAGSIISDPTFGMRILRVTDANTMADQPGQGYQTGSSAHTKKFNSNNTRIVLDSFGNRLLAYDFDPTSMTIKRVGKPGQPSGGDLIPLVGDDAFFSYQHADIIYGTRGGTNDIAKYNFATKQIATIFDPNTVDPSAGSRSNIAGVSRDDNVIGWYGGGNVQDADYLIIVYYQDTGKWRGLNTKSSRVIGPTGPTGPTDRPMGCTMHNARISLDGNYAMIVPSEGSCGGLWWIWNIPTLHLETITVDPGGHWGPGYRRLVNHCQVKDGQRWCIRDFADLNPASGTKKIPETILTPAEWANDNHPSWLNDVPGVDAPICLANYRADGSPIRRAWDNEVICVATDGSDRVWRFAHTRTSGTSWVNLPRGNVSQDGRFYMFNSNWEGTLGKRRADVFIVELK